MNTLEARAQCAQTLLAQAGRAALLSAFVGLDGFVDEILHVVDKRESAESYTRLRTISQLAARFAAAAGKSTNLELVNQVTKLGGNGPIMANALAGFGLNVTYLGLLGYPNLHPVFRDFAKRAEVHSIAEPGSTDALEFDDGKIMIGKHASLKQVTWENIQSRFGRDRFAKKFGRADLAGFVNWTMLPYMSDVWEAILKEICPAMSGPRRILFFDLADPEKRTPKDILRALDLIGRFEDYFDVILGLNEKEAHEIGVVLGLKAGGAEPEAFAQFGAQLGARLKAGTLVLHPVSYAVAVTRGRVDREEGPFTSNPRITTGAGSHFNSGFCLGRLLGLDNRLSLLVGVAASGFYVRTGLSPSIPQIAAMMTDPGRPAMILEIVKFGHPSLRQKGARVEKITADIKTLIADMFETMHAAKGVGLAAQQVGHALQLTVLDVRGATERPSTLELDGQPADVHAFMPLVLINPEFKGLGDPVVGTEGCLSFPELYAEISRPAGAEIRALNEKGKKIEFRCGGLLSRAIQHELDHLNGVLFIDRMSRADKDEMRAQLDELQAKTKAALKKQKVTPAHGRISIFEHALAPQ